MNRRSFLKRLGILAGAAVVAPTAVVSAMQYPDFVPGRTYHNGLCFKNGPWHKNNSNTRRGYYKLQEWLRDKVPPRFWDAKRVELFKEKYDYNTRIGVAVSYKSPLRPIR